jgi:hypothetical protein
MDRFKSESLSSRVRTLIALASVTGACGTASVDDETTEVWTDALLGGSLTTTRDEIGRVTIPNPTDATSSSCTATLISDRHFVTAAHCAGYFQYLEWPRGFATLRLTTGGIDDITNFFVKRWFGIGTAEGDKDIAVGELYDPVDLAVAEPAAIAESVPAASKSNPMTQTAYGYGCNDRNPSWSGQKQHLQFGWYPGYQVNWFCAGDSGGPTVGGTKYERGPLYGISSSFYAPFHADAVRYRDYILTLVDSTTSGNVCYRVSVAGPGLQPADCDMGTGGILGSGQPLEGFQAWSNIPDVTFTYRLHMKGVGWIDPNSGGYFNGGVNRGQHAEAIQITPNKGTVEYKVKIVGQSSWQSWVANGQAAGSPASRQLIEAIRIVYTP